MQNERNTTNPNREQDKHGPEDYWFRLRVEFQPLQRLNREETSLTLPSALEGKDIEIKAVPEGPINKASTIDFDVHGFMSHEEAHQAGLRFQKSVLVSAAQTSIGVDVGIDQSQVDQSCPVEEQGIRTQGYRMRNEMMGLTVHHGVLAPGMMASDAKLIHLPQAQPFFDRVVNIYAENPALTDNQTLALELFGLSQFETSERAILLVLTSVIEVLAEREQRGEDSQKAIDSMIEELQQSSLVDDQKASLIDGLKNLRVESISRACRRFVKTLLGKDAVKEFNDAYYMRSQILHSGKHDQGKVITGIGSAVFCLKDMIAAIFIRTIGNNDVTSP